MDMGCRNLDITLGLESSIVYDIFDVIEENCDLDEALIKDTRYENLYFIPAPQTRDTSSVEDAAVKGIWEKLSSRFDYCLVDAPAGIDGGFYMRLWVRTVPYWSQCPKLRHFVTVTEQYPCLKIWV